MSRADLVAVVLVVVVAVVLVATLWWLVVAVMLMVVVALVAGSRTGEHCGHLGDVHPALRPWSMDAIASDRDAPFRRLVQAIG